LDRQAQYHKAISVYFLEEGFDLCRLEEMIRNGGIILVGGLGVW